MKYLKILTITLVSFVGAKAFAYDFKIDGFYYNLNSYEMTVTVTCGESPYEGDIIIPNEVSYKGRTLSVKGIGEKAFENCVNLSSIKFGDSLINVGEYAFSGCTKIRRLTIPSNIQGIYKGAFYGCTSLEELIIEDGETPLRCNSRESPSSVFDCKLKYLYIGRDMGYPEWGETYNLNNTNLSTIIIGRGKSFIAGFEGAKISEITIPSNVTFIYKGAFKDCRNLTSVYFEDCNKELEWQSAYGTTIESISVSVAPFYDCPIKDAYVGRNITPTKGDTSLRGNEGPFDRTSLEKIVISESVTTLCGFNYCENIKEVVIPSSVQVVKGFIGSHSLETIRCMSEMPPSFGGFENNIYLNGILYVPTGSVNNYKNDKGWGKFFNIQEFSNDVPGTIQRCEKPTISYNMGKLSFFSTNGSICHSTITDSDISSYTANEVQLSVTYNISVYATKPGYDDSETTTATLCWIDIEPKTEGISNGVANVRANAVLIQNEGGQLIVNGAENGTQIYVYNLNGTLAGSTISSNGFASINTGIKVGAVAIVKIGERSIKVLLK